RTTSAARRRAADRAGASATRRRAHGTRARRTPVEPGDPPPAALVYHADLTGGPGEMADTIVHRLFKQAKKRPDAPAYLVKQSGVWHATSWSEYASQVE